MASCVLSAVDAKALDAKAVVVDFNVLKVLSAVVFEIRTANVDLRKRGTSF